MPKAPQDLVVALQQPCRAFRTPHEPKLTLAYTHMTQHASRSIPQSISQINASSTPPIRRRQSRSTHTPDCHSTKGRGGGGWWEHNKFSTNLYTTVEVIPYSRKTSGQVKQGITQDKAPNQFNNTPLVIFILYCHITRTKRDDAIPAI